MVARVGSGRLHLLMLPGGPASSSSGLRGNPRSQLTMTFLSDGVREKTLTLS